MTFPFKCTIFSRSNVYILMPKLRPGNQRQAFCLLRTSPLCSAYDLNTNKHCVNAAYQKDGCHPQFFNCYPIFNAQTADKGSNSNLSSRLPLA